MPDVKLAVRNDVLGKRRALSTESRKQKSQAIVDSLIKLSLFKDAMTIATYLPLTSEVDLSRLLRLEHRSKCFVALGHYQLRVEFSSSHIERCARGWLWRRSAADRIRRARARKQNRPLSSPTGSL